MAESISINFLFEDTNKIVSIFDKIGEKVSDSWYVPSNDDYEFIIYIDDTDYSEWPEEEGHEQGIASLLGGVSKNSYIFELRRSVQNAACDRIKMVLQEYFLKYAYVVDDDLGRIWDKSEIRDKNFLMDYYHDSQN